MCVCVCIYQNELSLKATNTTTSKQAASGSKQTFFPSLKHKANKQNLTHKFFITFASFLLIQQKT